MVGFQRCLASGTVIRHDKFASEAIPFEDFLKQASHDVCDAALEKLGQIFPLYEYDSLIVTGGTGAAWNEQIREKLKGLTSLSVINGNTNDPSLPFLLANVRGYFMYLYNVLERQMKAAQKKGNTNR